MNEKTNSRTQLFTTNGTIYVDAVRKVRNMVVKNGKVHALDVDPAMYKDADIVDLGGGAAYPGFIDSHVHLVAMAVVAGSGIRLDGTSKAEDIARVAAEACAKLPEGKLPLRVNYAFTFFDADEIDALADMGKDTEMVRFAGLKLFVGGAAGNGGAWTTFANTFGGHGLFAVYHDDTYGEKYNINRIVEKADERELDVHYHVQGDEAVEVVLRAIESVLEKKGRLNSVHTFYHLGFVTDGQIERMKKLGDHIVAGVQPAMHWGFMKQTLIDFYGEHGRVSYPYKKFKDAGITLAYSSDYPSNRLPFCGPTANMEITLTGGGDAVSHPPLTMEDLVRGFTVGSRATVCTPDIGSLDVDCRADIVVFDKDLYSLTVQELSKDNPKVLSTWVSGRKVMIR